jgi:hypothetical protein
LEWLNTICQLPYAIFAQRFIADNANLSLRFIAVAINDVFKADLSATKTLFRALFMKWLKAKVELVLPITFNPWRLSG